MYDIIAIAWFSGGILLTNDAINEFYSIHSTISVSSPEFKRWNQITECTE